MLDGTTTLFDTGHFYHGLLFCRLHIMHCHDPSVVRDRYTSHGDTVASAKLDIGAVGTKNVCFNILKNSYDNCLEWSCKISEMPAKNAAITGTCCCMIDKFVTGETVKNFCTRFQNSYK